MQIQWTLVSNTLFFVGGTTLLSFLIALPAAWLSVRSQSRYANKIATFVSFAYFVPSYLMAMAWVILANPQVGIIRSLSGGLLTPNIYSFLGLIFVESSCLYSIAYLSLCDSLSKIPPSLEEAAALAGASKWQKIYLIYFPLLKPTLMASALSVSLASLASFGVPAMIGNPARIRVFTTELYNLLRSGTDSGFQEAIKLSLYLSFFVALLLFIKNRILKESSWTLASAQQKSFRAPRLNPSLGDAFLLSLVILFVLLPSATLIIYSFVDPATLGQSKFEFSLKSWTYVFFHLSGFRSATFNSFKIAFLTSVILCLLSFAKLYGDWIKSRAPRTGFKWGYFSKIFDAIASMFYSLPGSIIAILLIYFSFKFSFLALNNSLAILVLATSLKYLVLASQVLKPAFKFFSPNWIEAAQLAGATFSQRLRLLWWPLMKSSLGVAFIIVFMPSFTELTMSLLLYGPETQTLGVLVFELQEYADRNSAAVVGVFFLILLGLLKWISSKGVSYARN